MVLSYMQLIWRESAQGLCEGGCQNDCNNHQANNDQEWQPSLQEATHTGLEIETATLPAFAQRALLRVVVLHKVGLTI